MKAIQTVLFSLLILALAGGNTCVFAQNVAEVYPEMFGAVRDGITDDSAAINAAIQSLPATGGTLRCHDGTYLLGGAVSYCSNLTIEGQNTTVFKRSSTNTGALFQCATKTNVDNVTFRNFTIDGNKAGISSITYAPDISIQPSGGNYLISRILIENLCIHDAFAHPIFIRGGGDGSTYLVDGVKVINCTLKDAGRADLGAEAWLSVEGWSRNVQILNNVVSGFYAQSFGAIDFNGGGGTCAEISGNHVYNCSGNAIEAESGSDKVIISGNITQGNGAYGVAVYACAGPTVNNVIISKNISESDRSGIWVSGKGDGVAQANNVIITDNLILSPTGSGGIILYGDGTGITIANNSVTGSIVSGSSGIYLASGSGSSPFIQSIITGNRVSGFQYGIITSQGAIQFTNISNNIITNCSQWCIRLSSGNLNTLVTNNILNPNGGYNIYDGSGKAVQSGNLIADTQ